MSWSRSRPRRRSSNSAWVSTRLLLLLPGQADGLIADLTAAARADPLLFGGALVDCLRQLHRRGHFPADSDGGIVMRSARKKSWRRLRQRSTMPVGFLPMTGIEPSPSLNIAIS